MPQFVCEKPVAVEKAPSGMLGQLKAKIILFLHERPWRDGINFLYRLIPVREFLAVHRLMVQVRPLYGFAFRQQGVAT
jgi:hypothetical protein